MNIVKERKMELCLCKRCLEGFFRTGNYRIRRSDPIEVIREPCIMCQVGYGYDWESPLFKNFRETSSCEYDVFGSHSRYWWLEEISNPSLTIGLGALTEDDKELLTLYIVEQKTECEIAKVIVIIETSMSARYDNGRRDFYENCT